MNLEKMNDHIPQTVLKYAVPSIVAMILTSLITIVDGLFIGNYIGKDAIAAVNLGLPILYLYLGFGIMIGVGGSVIAGQWLGGRKREESIAVFNQTAATAVITLLMMSGVFLLALASMADRLIGDEGVRSFFYRYYFIMLFVYPFMVLNTVLGMFIRIEGKPEAFMQITILAIAVNIVLDYLFIAVLDRGIEGIAYGSLFSVLTGFVCMLLYFRGKSAIFRFGKFSPSRKVLTETFLNGSSEFIGQLSMSITMFALNHVILREVGVNGIAAFTIVGYVSFLFGMIVSGFGQGANPVMSYSYGAEEFILSRKARNVTIIYVFILGLVTLLLLNLFSGSYSNLFVKNTAVREMVEEGIPLYSLAFLFMGFNVIASFYFTSIGEARESAVISASRGLIVLLICILVFPSLWGMTGVWLAAPVTELVTIVFSTLFILRHDSSHRINVDR